MPRRGCPTPAAVGAANNNPTTHERVGFTNHTNSAHHSLKYIVRAGTHQLVHFTGFAPKRDEREQADVHERDDVRRLHDRDRERDLVLFHDHREQLRVPLVRTHTHTKTQSNDQGYRTRSLSSTTTTTSTATSTTITRAATSTTTTLVRQPRIHET